MFLKILQINRKIPVPETLFHKVAENIAKILRTAI